MKKYCVKCGKQFEATGREVICPACKAQAAEDAKRAAVLKAKRASWNGESVPVRISGRASTVIREYGATNNLPFAQALDELLRDTQFVKGMDEMGVKWEDITPYKSHRRDKATTASKPQDAQAAGKPQEVKTAGKATSKATSKPQTAGKAASKTSASKATSTSKK